MKVTNHFDRREFLSTFGMTAAGLLVGCESRDLRSDLDDYLLSKMDRSQIPGLAAAIIQNSDVIWSKGYGWADIDRGIEMTADTLQNIGSISKTFVATAIMQLKERGDLTLDDDVNEFLDFSLRNPNHADVPITVLDLMTHRSSIADGSAYARGYVCGDSTILLRDWVRGYFEADGAFFNRDENFHAWAPGERMAYNNVAFGLLAHLVEVISGVSFDQYCRNEIFEPIGMTDTAWHLRDIDSSRHAVPYSLVSKGEIRGPDWGGTELGVIGGNEETQVTNGYAANCLYNHANFPDGFLRTTVHQLAKYQIAYLNWGSIGGKRILSEASIREMLSPTFADTDSPGSTLGLVWWRRELPDGDFVWEHTGGDPGINTLFSFNPSSGRGVIVFTNTWGADLAETRERLLKEL